MSSLKRLVPAAGLMVALALPALAEGDPEQGAKVFRKCMACHSVEAGAKSKAGPNLHDVVGRVSGTLGDFKYSPAMIKAGEEGHIWTVEEIDKFVENPKSMIKGHKMTFAGLKKPEERADVIAYLVSLNPGGAGEAAPVSDPPAAEAAPSN